VLQTAVLDRAIGEFRFVVNENAKHVDAALNATSALHEILIIIVVLGCPNFLRELCKKETYGWKP
jgi:hypothetical protein